MTKPQISKSNVATIEGLEKRRVKQEGIIATLRAAHTQSVIDGAEFDSGPIRVAEDELTAIITAQETLYELELEYERQEAENQAKLTDHEKRKRIADKLTKMGDEWLGDVQNIEDATRTLAAAYGRAEGLAHMLNVGLLSQGTKHTGLMPGEFKRRVGDGISSIMRKQVEGGSMGDFKFKATARDPDLSWSVVEKPASQAVAATVERLLSDEEAEAA